MKMTVLTIRGAITLFALLLAGIHLMAQGNSIVPDIPPSP